MLSTSQAYLHSGGYISTSGQRDHPVIQDLQDSIHGPSQVWSASISCKDHMLLCAAHQIARPSSRHVFSSQPPCVSFPSHVVVVHLYLFAHSSTLETSRHPALPLSPGFCTTDFPQSRFSHSHSPISVASLR